MSRPDGWFDLFVVIIVCVSKEIEKVICYIIVKGMQEDTEGDLLCNCLCMQAAW